MKSRKLVNVLIADDSPPLRRRVRELLATNTDIRVVAEANDTETSVAAIRMFRPHAVILDLRMPGGGGFKVLEAIHDLDPRPLVIMLTNYVDPPYRQKCLAAGADHFLDKSSEFEQVAGLLEHLARDAAPSPQPAGSDPVPASAPEKSLSAP